LGSLPARGFCHRHDWLACRGRIFSSAVGPPPDHLEQSSVSSSKSLSGSRLWAPSSSGGATGERKLAGAVWGRMKAHGEAEVLARGCTSSAGSCAASTQFGFLKLESGGGV
ncbi:unnamed protein product, partial [Polarella glacialis]